MSYPAVGLGRISLGSSNEFSGSREEMKMWPDGWEWALNVLLEGSGLRISQPGVYPWSFSPSSHFFAKISLSVFKDGFNWSDTQCFKI